MMKKSTKGALAAGAAGVLLLGGAGSLAYWTDAGTVTGTDITSGHLSLGTADCGDGWNLDGETDAFVPASDPIVPGDVLTQVCEFTVDAAGTHIAATLGVSAPAYGSASSTTLKNDLTTTATYTVNGATVNPADVTLADGDVIEATVNVAFKTTSANATQDLDAMLKDITVTATQTHKAPAATTPAA